MQCRVLLKGTNVPSKQQVIPSVLSLEASFYFSLCILPPPDLKKGWISWMSEYQNHYPISTPTIDGIDMECHLFVFDIHLKFMVSYIDSFYSFR